MKGMKKKGVKKLIINRLVQTPFEKQVLAAKINRQVNRAKG